MHFSELDKTMRVYEESSDQCVLPGMYMVARLDGRGFTKLTKKKHYDKPFDSEFKCLMIAVVKHLMEETGFNFIYGYTESDEISLLFHPEENTFNRKLRKLNSVLASEASAKASLILAEVATFDCRISQLPNPELVVDYFRWRQEDANRNALNGYCYWTLRRHDISKRKATSMLNGQGKKFKNELLFNYGINYNDVPAWQKRGIGFGWETYEKEGFNPVTNTVVYTERTRLEVIEELPLGAVYAMNLMNLLHTHTPGYDSGLIE